MQLTDAEFLGKGWSFPPTFDRGNLQLQMTSGSGNINQSIDIILSTMLGEQPLNPTFGSAVNNFVFKNMDENTQGQLISAITTALVNNEPRVTVNEVDLQISDDAEPMAMVTIDYTVRNTNSRHNHVYPFSLNEGTLLVQTGR